VKRNAGRDPSRIALRLLGPRLIPRHIFALQRIELVLTHQTRARVMGSYISNRNVCAQTWNLFNDGRCTLPENWTRIAPFDSEIPAQRARTISPLPSSRTPPSSSYASCRWSWARRRSKRRNPGTPGRLRVDSRKFTVARLAPKKLRRPYKPRCQRRRQQQLPTANPHSVQQRW
jgi:hypothetical protein